VFGVDSTELLIIALAALIFIGPKELPGTLRSLGRAMASVRAQARQFTGGMEIMMREAELAEMEAKWRADTAAARCSPETAPASTTEAVPLVADRPGA
jgi:sec-independent protein translocase protein TatB